MKKLTYFLLALFCAFVIMLIPWKAFILLALVGLLISVYVLLTKKRKQ